MNRTFLILPCWLMLAAIAAVADAQQTEPEWNLACATQQSVRENYLTCKGSVEFEQGDTKLYADELEWFKDQNRVVASGNVTFTQGRNQISADRADFDTKSRLGTFYAARGFANIQPVRPTPTPGAYVAPQRTGQATDVYFFGEVVEKIGPKKYKIKNGGFTTCVQPTPRWDLQAGTVTLNVDDYTLLRNAVLNVKSVPLLYLPIMYYPTNKEDRATGFLLPTYGHTTQRGEEIHNAFFWVIDRSQDATFFHDWFSRTGQGLGSEYRYNFGSGDGTASAYLLNEHDAVYQTGITPGERSYRLLADANQTLPGRLRARARVDYFSSLRTNQTFNTNIYDSSRSDRRYGGNVVGAWKRYSLTGTFDRVEHFNSLASSAITGTSPAVSVSQLEQPLFRGSSPVYFSFGSEYSHLDRLTKADDVVTDDRSLGRVDFTPRLRYPFKRWQWLTVNSSVGWRDTFYSRSQDPVTGAILDESLNRRYFTLQADALGPVFNRVWDTPNNGYAEKFKHTIEPSLSFQRTSPIDNFNRVVSGVDAGIVGGTTSYTYGLNNRFYAKRKIGQTSQAQEIATIQLSQTYYTEKKAAQVDPNYETSFSGTQPSHLSPLRLAVRVMPSATFHSSLNAEFDTKYRELRTLSASGTHIWAGGATTVTWSQQFFIKNLAGFNNPEGIRRALNVTSNPHTRDNRYGGTYSINYDAVHSTVLQQGVSMYYNAQCCGIGVQYLRTNYPSGFAPIAADHKFFVSFTLAGLGSFSPFNGALSGIPR